MIRGEREMGERERERNRERWVRDGVWLLGERETERDG